MSILNKNIYFLVLVICILLPSCDPLAYKTIYVLKPADTQVPGDIQRVKLIDRSRSGNNRYYGNKTEENSEKQIKYAMDSLMSYWIFQGVLDKFSNSPRFDLPEKPVKTVLKAKSSQYNKFFTWDEVDTLCVTDTLDAIIVLEYYVNDSVSNKVSYDQGSGLYRGAAIVINSTLWRIYDYHEHKIIDQHWQYDTTKWEALGYYSSDVAQNIPSRDETLFESCFKTGQKYGTHIAHQWNKVTRIYYQRSNRDFKKAAKKVESDDWKDAAIMWKKYVNSTDSVLAARACFNMAVACEVLDDIDAALDWAAKSYFKANLPGTEEYLTILEKRKQDKLKILNQLKP